jgi:hypothetical protein
MGTQEILDQVLVWAVHSFVNKMNKEMKTSSYDQRDEVSERMSAKRSTLLSHQQLDRYFVKAKTSRLEVLPLRSICQDARHESHVIRGGRDYTVHTRT